MCAFFWCKIIFSLDKHSAEGYNKTNCIEIYLWRLREGYAALSDNLTSSRANFARDGKIHRLLFVPPQSGGMEVFMKRKIGINADCFKDDSLTYGDNSYGSIKKLRE